eukprot:SAG31_NODE_4259_length_3410_cov_2.021444_2_plen_249_part_00
MLRTYVSKEPQCKAAFEEFLAAVPAKPVDSAASRKISGGSTIVSALHSAAAFINENEDYGTNAFRKFGNLLPFVAGALGDVETLKYLVGAGVNVMNARADGVTALLLATECDHPNAVEYLLQQGADAKVTDSAGMSPLLASAERGLWETGLLLLRHGDRGAELDPNMSLQDGTTALIIAAENGSAQFVELMLEAGSNVDLQMKDGTTALFMAAQEGHDNIVILLLQAGAKPDIRRNDGFSPLLIGASI